MPAPALAYLVALHDIGKFSRGFQSMVPEHWPAAALGPFPVGGLPPGPRHDAMGLHLFNKLPQLLEPILPSRVDDRDAWDSALRAPLLRAIAGHHGRPPEPPFSAPAPALLCSDCLAAAAGFGKAMQAVFAPPPLPCPDDLEIARWAWQLAGITTLADWVGSRQAWFPYVTPEAVADPAAYFWNHALPRAAAALAAAGLLGTRPAPFEGLSRLFPRIKVATPVQGWAETVALPDGPLLAVIEDQTGSGKTEAALILAHRLLADGRADGLYVALPTMSTANAMFGRLAEAYRRLFTAEGHPSLALAHGRADLDPRFSSSISGERLPASSPANADPADEPSESHCAAWLADDRRKALLAQVGVGTLDQALMAVLPVRHAALRLQGLARKVLVVDEVHAFDAYMRRELLTLLEFHAALGGSSVLLSATLPRRIRGDLVTAFRRGLGARAAELSCTAYPLATLAAAVGVQEAPCAPRDGLARRVAVTRLDDAEAALARIIEAADRGAAVAWVRNTVDDAIAAAEALRARGIEPLLFHARFAMCDRLAIEAEVLQRFGRDSSGTARRGVVVATQVIEQSLDLDFDLLVTDLAPVDLIIQRAGRLWRHDRKGRKGRPELLVISPEPVEHPAADWIARPQPGTVAVYRDAALLWRSARAIFRRGVIAAPEDMRPLIEEVFDDTAEGAIPPALAASAERAKGQDHAATGLARQNLLVFDQPYERASGLWEPDTWTPTRLDDQPQVTLKLALLRDGAVVPYAVDEDPARAWALSEVRIAQKRIAAVPIPCGLEGAAEAAKATWGRWERESASVLLAILEPDGDDLKGPALDESRSPCSIRYSAGIGLRVFRS
jgi:CRISPR-associated endonuclease/helicase Cas3